ncbi:MAG: fatty acid desaturase [Leptolyngbyaceae cyanobacterium SL_5_9]|nr:fatty acid desaturase [Leptolyngbyaceae cyanobacterium SL_5_9]
MKSVDEQLLIPQADYIKLLRPLLPAEAFAPDPNKLVILLLNLVILGLGWAIATHLDQWHTDLLWLYLPLTLIMGNSIIVLLFSSHALMHGSVIKNPRLIHWIGFLGLAMWWMPPTLWKAVHNREHHGKTNSLADPDRNYLSKQPNTWGKWIQHQFVPSSEVNMICLAIGMGTAWGIHGFRNLTSVLLFNRKDVDYVPAAFTVSVRERWAIAQEILLISMLHFSIMAYLNFEPVKLILSYFLPIGIGYAGAMFYIFTNHMLCQMTSINDPLVNSVSLKIPKLFDVLHLNFSYHTEHHIFPGINSDYYPVVQKLLQTYHPKRFNLLEAREVWRLLMQTPRHHQNDTTFTDWLGKKSVICPLSHQPKD